MKKMSLLLLFCLSLCFNGFSQTHGNTTTSNTTTSFGTNAGTTNTNNTFFGYYAGLNNSASYNTFVGFEAGALNTTGDKNTFVGNGASVNNTTGIWNTTVGYNASRKNITGGSNTNIGVHASYENLSGSDNVSLGTFAGRQNSSGSKNTYLGVRSGFNNQGSRSVFIGYNSGANESGSDKLYIDNSDTNKPLIKGDFNSNELVVYGSLGVGTDSFEDISDNMIYKFSVAGNIRAHGVKVYTDWADFVFEKEYKLPSLEEVEAYIIKHGHLKDIPSADEVEKNGIEVGEMNKLLLQKIEELTLYTIELKKEIDELKKNKE
jgi:hypothetical protein